MALVVAQEVPTSSTMAVPHGPSGVRVARRRMREELRACGTPDTVVDDAILILSELLSNACRHARPLHEDSAPASSANGTGSTGSTSNPVNPVNTVRASWRRDVRGEVTIAVTDGGGPTRPLAAKPSVTARGGRGLAIITALARDWGVRSEPDAAADESPGVTVWAVLRPESSFSGRVAASLGALDGELGGELDGELGCGLNGGFDFASVDELK
ncbi:ATP-binding protein [Streptomyces spirodelae]|uniref:ATP-binding protein n=1 Tax=Streptomyces spirodelae TaxID=2812904 RepID=A0ABS3X4I6_9ACTN|nr:ATP-binding protein [Streptomyces spirodelae]MBO8189981.1 ATP-binding protein [Streptomyces spirodelae]